MTDDARDAQRAPYTLADFDYDLPPELIAQRPSPQRSGSRLLHVDGCRLEDLRFSDLPSLVGGDDLVVFNDTRVIHARLRGRKATGGEVEMLVERVIGAETALVQMKASHPPRVGSAIALDARAHATVVRRDGRFFELRFAGTGDLSVWLEHHGEVPLPPYITHRPDLSDAERYQTVYARSAGAVAAPTAGLHFDDDVLARLDARGVRRATLTLHVGAGTFQPVRVENIAEHKMHSEWYQLPDTLVDAIAKTRARGGRIVAVGTTSMRALEAAARDAEAAGRPLAATSAETDIFITPGYRFRIVDRLVTNFHLPKSTLLMLVSAFAGVETIRTAYRHAIESRYRFFSYGDAMLLTRRDD